MYYPTFQERIYDETLIELLKDWLKIPEHEEIEPRRQKFQRLLEQLKTNQDCYILEETASRKSL